MLRFLASISTSKPWLGEIWRKWLERCRRSPNEVLHFEEFPSVSFALASLSTCPADPLIWNESRDLALLWRGELFHESADLGILAGRQLAPSELGIFILQQYEKLGIAGLARLNGSFSGALVDLRTGVVIIFNDRFGLNRIYVHETADAIFFASEAKYIMAARPEVRQLDLSGIGEWLSCGCVLQNRTLYKGISLLPPASAWIFSPADAVRKIHYFDRAAWFDQPSVSNAAFEEELLATFPKVVKRYFAGYQTHEVGMSLTGGLDGRMVLAWSPSGPGELPCYTFNGPLRDCADVRIARRLAAAVGQPHQTIPIGSQFFEQFPTLAQECIQISDGTMDVSGASEIYGNRLARQIAPVRLTGNYGSETVRANVAFKSSPIPADLFSPETVGAADAAKITYDTERNEKMRNPSANARLGFIAFKQVPWHHYARWSVEQSQLRVRSPFLDNDLLSLLFRAPPDLLPTLGPSLKSIAAGNPALARIPTDRGVSWPASPLRNDLLRKYHDFWAKAEYAYDYGMPQKLAKLDSALSFLRLERIFLGRQKFCHYRSWYRTQLSDFVRDTLLSPTALARPYLNGQAAVKAAVEDHIRGTRNFTVPIHKLLTLELIHKNLLAL